MEISVRITEPEPSLRHQIEQALVGKSVRLARVESSSPQRESREFDVDFTVEPLRSAGIFAITK